MSDSNESRAIGSAARREAQLKVLARTADKIRIANEKVQEGMRYSLQYAIKAGHLLNQCKKQIGHGGWLEWFEASQFDFSERTAQRYMTVYTHWKVIAAKLGTDGNPTTLADLTFSDALSLLNKTPRQPTRITHKNGGNTDNAVHTMSNADQANEDGKPKPVRKRMHIRSDEWQTPEVILQRVTTTLQHIDLDPAADSERSVNASLHYSATEDGLAKTNRWSGRVFLNPPVTPCLTDQFVIRLVDAFGTNEIDEAILLAPADIDQKWFRRLAKFPRVFLDRAITGNISGMPDPLVAVYLGKSIERFFATFKQLGDAYIAVG